MTEKTMHKAEHLCASPVTSSKKVSQIYPDNYRKQVFDMECAYTDKVKTIVADTYLAYTSDIDGAEAFRRFVSRTEPLIDVRRDPRFSAFTDEELIDEMVLLEEDILIVIRGHVQKDSHLQLECK